MCGEFYTYLPNGTLREMYCTVTCGIPHANGTLREMYSAVTCGVPYANETLNGLPVAHRTEMWDCVEVL